MPALIQMTLECIVKRTKPDSLSYALNNFMIFSYKAVKQTSGFQGLGVCVLGRGLALGIFLGARNVLYLDCNGGYIIACIMKIHRPLY